MMAGEKCKCGRDRAWVLIRNEAMCAKCAIERDFKALVKL